MIGIITMTLFDITYVTLLVWTLWILWKLGLDEHWVRDRKGELHKCYDPQDLIIYILLIVCFTGILLFSNLTIIPKLI